MIAKLQSLFFFLLILFLPTQFGKHFWPDFAYVLGQRVDYLSPTLYFTDILAISFVILFFIGRLKILRYYDTKILREELKIGKKQFPLLISQYLNILVSKQIILAFLFLFLSIGIYLSINPFAGWYYLLKLFEYILLSFAFIDFLTTRHPGPLRRSFSEASLSRIPKRSDKNIVNKVQANYLGILDSFVARMTIVLPLTIGIIFESLLAIAQFFHQGSIGGILYYLGERTFNGDTPGIANASLNGRLVLRPYSTFPHPNVLAAYLLIGLAILIFNIKDYHRSIADFRRSGISDNQLLIHGNQRHHLQLILYFLALFLGTIGLFLTLSRIAILLWIIIFSFILGHNLWDRIKHLVHPTYYLLFIPSIFLSMLILLLTFLPDLKYRILTTGLSDESVSSRIELIQAAQKMIIHDPFFGVGFGNFLPNLPLYSTSWGRINLLQPVHNIFYLLAAEAGIPGLLFFLWFMGKTFLKIKRSPPNILISQYLNILLLALVIALGMFDHYFLTLQQGQLLFTLVLSLCCV